MLCCYRFFLSELKYAWVTCTSDTNLASQFFCRSIPFFHCKENNWSKFVWNQPNVGNHIFMEFICIYSLIFIHVHTYVKYYVLNNSRVLTRFVCIYYSAIIVDLKFLSKFCSFGKWSPGVNFFFFFDNIWIANESHKL